MNNYDQELKERFIIRNTNKGTQKNYEFILRKAATSHEIILKKGVYNFNMEELNSLIGSYSNRSIEMIASNVSCLRNYIAFAIQEGYTSTNINLLDGIGGKKFLEQFLDKNAGDNKYITFKQLIELENQCLNPQDAVIPELLFVGVKGENYHELRNLKITDISEDEIILPDRIIPISARTYDLIKDAIEQVDYYRGNGEDLGMSKSKSFKIKKSEYVVRTGGSKKSESEINCNTLISRVNRIKYYFNNPYLNITNIWVSGVIHFAKEIMKENNRDLEKEDYEKIGERFGYHPTHWTTIKTKIIDYL